MLPISEIERAIGYTFRNKDLLRQAFVRKSYSAEQGGQNNEVLEFIGDAVLCSVVTRMMMERFGRVANGEDAPQCFCTKYGEGEFTDIRQDLVQEATLAKAMDALGFHAYLVMGQGDIKQGVQNEAKVKADLFEAVLGAVALDADWNMDVLTRVVSNMADFTSYFENVAEHLRRLRQKRIKEAVGELNEKTAVVKANELYQKGFVSKPRYTYTEEKGGGTVEWRCECFIKEIGCSVSGNADTKQHAQNAAAYEALLALLGRAEE